MRKKLLTSLASVLFVAALHAGTYYEATTVSTADQGGMNTSVTAWIDGDRAKVLFRESDNPMLEEDGYILTTDGAKTMYFVNPAERTYMEWDIEALMGGLGSAMQNLGGMMKMEFANAETDLLSQGPGPELHGLATTHTVFESSYDMVIRVMGMGQESHVESRNELWTTTELPDAGFGAWLRKEPPATGIEGLDDMLSQQVDVVEGFPLKSIVTTTTTDKKRGRSQTSTVTTEVTVLREEAIDPVIYELDPSWTRTEMPDLQNLMGGS